MMHRYGRLAFAGALGLALCSCAETQARMAAQRQAQLDATNAAARDQCRSFSTTPGTPIYTQCGQQGYPIYVGDARQQDR
jgi:hypothetical protein